MLNYLLISTVGISLYTDIKYRKIFNAVTLPGMLIAFAYHGMTGGTEGILFSLKGLLLGGGLFLLPFIMGGLGAGDVKLLATVGALKGPHFVLQVFLTTALIGGLITGVILAKEGRLLSTLKRMFLSLFYFLFSKTKMSYLNHRHIEAEGSFPYGLAIALGTLFSILWVR